MLRQRPFWGVENTGKPPCDQGEEKEVRESVELNKRAFWTGANVEKKERQDGDYYKKGQSPRFHGMGIQKCSKVCGLRRGIRDDLAIDWHR